MISVSGCGEFNSWEESGLCSDGESIFRVSQSLTAGAWVSLYSQLLTDDSVHFDNEALCVFVLRKSSVLSHRLASAPKPSRIS